MHDYSYTKIKAPTGAFRSIILFLDYIKRPNVLHLSYALKEYASFN